MKRSSVVVIAILGLCWMAATGWSEEGDSIPVGVSPDSWVPISDTVGLVVGPIQHVQKPVYGQTIHAVAEAVLMTKVNGQWIVVQWPEEPVELRKLDRQ